MNAVLPRDIDAQTATANSASVTIRILVAVGIAGVVGTVAATSPVICHSAIGKTGGGGDMTVTRCAFVEPTAIAHNRFVSVAATIVATNTATCIVVVVVVHRALKMQTIPN